MEHRSPFDVFIGIAYGDQQWQATARSTSECHDGMACNLESYKCFVYAGWSAVLKACRD